MYIIQVNILKYNCETILKHHFKYCRLENISASREMALNGLP